MKSTKIIIKTKSKIYPIYFGDKILGSIGRIIKEKIPSIKKIVILFLKYGRGILTKVRRSQDHYLDTLI